MSGEPSIESLRDEVCILLLTLNESAIIGEIVDRFQNEGFENILVMDGGSTDGTPEIAENHGARVVHQQESGGKGQGVREAFGFIDVPYILMADGDGTYRPEDAETMLEPLLTEDVDHVIGNRFADMEEDAMTRLNSVGNTLIQHAFQLVHQDDLGDILSGYRAFSRESVEQMHLSASGFGIETEMAVECVRHDIPTAEVPITYQARPAETESKLNPFSDGATIWWTLLSLAKTSNPLFYFGSLGALSMVSGAAVAAFVGYEWFVNRVSHEVLALVAASGILVGVFLLLFALLSDMIQSFHSEQKHRIKRLEDKIDNERQTGQSEIDAGRED
jgi:dolichol-phosphate mannosyltransferase